MKSIAIASAFLAAALVASPAEAVSPATQATGQAIIYRPLTISFVQNLDFGELIQGSGTFSQVISMDQAGVLTGCGANVTCSGTPKPAQYKLVGTNNALVTISCPGFNLTGPGTLAFTPNAPGTVNLGASGATTGVTFGIGGSITIANTTADGTYTGIFNVTANYQ